MSIGSHLRRYMAAGIVTLVPVIVTGLFMYWLIGRTEFVSEELSKRGWLPFEFPGMGLIVSLVVVLVTIYIVGVTFSNFVGRRLLRYGEAIIERVPIVKTIYVSVKQIADSVGMSHKGLFQKVILFEYPKEDVWTIGFVTGIAKGQIQKKVPERLVNVFVPTTPNPTSGYLLMVPEEKLISTDLTVEEAMRIIVSGGIATPTDSQGLEETIAVCKEDILPAFRGEGEGEDSPNRE